MEYIEEDRKKDEEDIREVGFWTTRNKVIAGGCLLVFVVVAGVFFIGSSLISSSGSDSSSDDNTQPPVEGDAWAEVSGAPDWARDAVFSPDEFDHCFVDDISDQGPGVVLCWQVTTPPKSRENRGRLNGDDITFGVAAVASADDSTWLGLGWSANGGMYGADIVTYSLDLGLQDRFSKAWAKPQLDGDGVENVEFLEGGVQGDSTRVISFVFRRAVEVCEEGKENDFDVVDGLNNVIWAVGAVAGDITFHTSRGSILLDLLSGNNPPSHEIHTGYADNNPQTSHGEQTTSFYFLMGDAEGGPISLADYTEGTDTYLCKMFVAPEVPKKQHVLEVDAIIEHSQFVHHILLYHCVGTEDDEEAHWFEPGSCNMGCMSIAAAWAVGGYSRYHFPEQVGFPFGETPGKRDYFRLEIHYNTVTRPSDDIFDQSGFRIRYGEPREYDAGSFFFGWSLQDEFQMPIGKVEGSPETTWEAYVTPDCLSPVLEDEGIHVFSSMFHMHQYGRSSLLQRYRGGREIEPFDQLDYYDFNYQRIVPTSQTILPGDSLKLTCRYDTTTATETVESGEGSGDEMCLFFFSYYPRYKQLDYGVATFTDSGPAQQIWCGGGGLLEVNKTHYEQLPKYTPPARQTC